VVCVASIVAPSSSSRAVVRATSLSGVANRYIALTLPPDGARELDDGATIDATHTTSIVDLDQLFNTLDEPTRADLQKLVKAFARQYQGVEADTQEAIRYFNPLLSTSRRLVNELTEDEGTLTRFLVSSSKTVAAVAERRDDLAALVGNTNTTAGAIAAENVSLSRALELLPTTMRRANTTFVNLRATLDDLDALVDESKPATRELEPFLRQLRPLVADARPTVRDLRRLVGRAGPDNDLTDAVRKLPNFARVTRPAVNSSRGALRKLQPVLEFARPYAPELIGWIKDFGQAAAPYDANGHYARIQPIFNAFQFTETPGGDGGDGVLTPIPPEQRLDALQTGHLQRCPGASTQPVEDGSNPWNPPPVDCDPSQVPPGP
jgi:phospholipid/cholesterol/gamma-HCH transport system substrate-binding protein